MFAAMRGDLEMVKLLLDRGCKVDASDNETGWTALVWARKAGHLEVANLLQARGPAVPEQSVTTGQVEITPSGQDGSESFGLTGSLPSELSERL